MTVTAHPQATTDYRRGKELLCVAEPGKIVVHIFGLQSLAEVEEYISALRLAAKEAQLPETRKD